jgi:membrane protein
MRELESFVELVKRSARGLSEDRAPMMGAALAYYTSFAIAPLLLLAIPVVKLLFGSGANSGVYEMIRSLVGPNGAAVVHSMVQASKPRAGAVSALVGVASMTIGCSAAFQQLQDSLNVIWRVAAKPGRDLRQRARRLLIFLGTMAVAVALFLLSFAVSAGIYASDAVLRASMPGERLLWAATDFFLFLSVAVFMCSAIFKFLPDVELSWRDVGVGGAVTGFLFMLGQQLIALYLARSGVASSYGAAGTVIVVLLWIYYSSEILLFGAEFTRAYVTRAGRWPDPKSGARTLKPR